MFQRAPVRGRLGGWDRTRFGADSELIARAGRAFGMEALSYLETGPLSFQQLASGSLTAEPASAVNGPFFGARREYQEAWRNHIARNGELRYDPEEGSRPYAVPRLLQVSGLARDKQGFDLIVLADLAAPMPEVERLARLIERRARAGTDITLVETHHRAQEPGRGTAPMEPGIRALLNAGLARVLVYGERAPARRISDLSEGEVTRYLPGIRQVSGGSSDSTSSRARPKTARGQG